ncbi:MAG TPA: oligosaccharide flippase family protein [Kofleriaceae bacterium]|nr:oligosaccharide flippase family protein [Kofleriaceae bacterium]
MAASLRANFLWALVGSTAFQVCQWVAVIAITKLSSTAVAGDWNLALAITAPIFLFTQLKLRAVQTTDARDEFVWAEYAANRIAGSLAALVLTGAVVAIAYRDATGPLILLVAVSKVVDGASDLVYGRLQRHERLDRIGRSLIVRGLTGTAAGIAAFWVTRSAAWSAAATAAGYLPWFFWDLRSLRHQIAEPLAPRWNSRRQRALFLRVVPLGVATAVGSLQTNIPRYFVDAYGTRTDVGVYGNLSYLLVAGNLVIAAIANAVMPRLSRDAASGDWRSFLRLLRGMILAGIVLATIAVVASALIGAPVLRLLYSEHEAANADVLVWMSAATGLVWSYIFLATALDAMRRYAIQPWIHGTGTAVIAGASALLVPHHGLHGAAWATCIGYSVECSLFLMALWGPLRRAARAARAARPADT